MPPNPVATAAPGDGENVLTGRVKAVSFLAATTRCDVVVDDATIQVSTESGAAFAVGTEVSLSFPLEKSLAVPSAGT